MEAHFKKRTILLLHIYCQIPALAETPAGNQALKINQLAQAIFPFIIIFSK
jgi:hypothetical protein